ncbi:hypothetical protein K0M31_013022 [Melipona bicolor]|uniref:Uncharacterized protein n=1 Tax=Melipona bicolor TaxID=60889 RepID=A0AA40FIP8_9HYME|nr:hypothetical protein K0M31_013022 [Melipona bicolor]
MVAAQCIGLNPISTAWVSRMRDAIPTSYGSRTGDIEDLEILESDIDDCDVEGPMTQRISRLPTMTSLRPDDRKIQPLDDNPPVLCR